MASSLKQIRDSIEEIDEKIIQLLRQRLNLVPEIVSIKQKEHIPIFHPEREQALFEKYHELAQEYGLDPEFIHDIFARIIIEMKDLQRIRSISKN
ncbi:MAG: hypothetical protein DRO88_03420 [Promethearchaeia archaeon]|nr:MAG: hypothetical protein DRO88_03420 [Candidatus Lokiarchaeia archaeon]